MTSDIGTRQEKAQDLADWKRAHGHLLRLARHRAGLDLEEGRWLLLAFRAGTHVRLGYGSFAEYVERVMGYGPRLTHDKLRVAEALEGLPQIPRALESGQLSWSAARELTRVATPETESEWLAAARGRTVRDVERLVSGRELGSRPQDPVTPNARRHVLRFEVMGETLAAFRDAIAKLRRDTGGPVDDDTALMLMARQVLGGPKDEGRASYQVALTVCEDCGRGQQHAQGELLDVSAELVDMARCDAQNLPSAHAVGDARAAVSAGGDNTAKAGASGSPSTHVGRANAGRTARARQDIPPAVRRLVLRRDRGRCVFPGCRHATFVDIHHIVFREDDGENVADNLVTVCGAHHRAIHRGHVFLLGSVSLGVRFFHADGTVYGDFHSAAAIADDERSPASARAWWNSQTPTPLPTDATSIDGVELPPTGGVEASIGPYRRATSSPDPERSRRLAARALRHMGFAEAETNAALAQAAAHLDPRATLEQLLRWSLDVLTSDLPRAS